MPSRKAARPKTRPSSGKVCACCKNNNDALGSLTSRYGYDNQRRKMWQAAVRLPHEQLSQLQKMPSSKAIPAQDLPGRYLSGLTQMYLIIICD